MTNERAMNGAEAMAVLNILLRDSIAMRQRLFSYLQFYLTVQSGLGAFFGYLTHESVGSQYLPMVVSGIAILSGAGLLASLAVFAYGVIVLRPGDDSRYWIGRALQRVGRLDDVDNWSEVCRARLHWLQDANLTLDRHVARIRVGIFAQLCFAMFVFALWHIL